MARSTGRRSDREGSGAPRRSRGSRSSDSNNEEEGEVYEVEAVVGKRRRKGATEYLVQWKGFAERTWEPERHLSCDELIRDYERQHVVADQGADADADADDTPLSSTDLYGKQSMAERASRFVLVADDWGTESSTVLILQRKEHGQSEQDDAPVLLQCVTVDAQSKSVGLYLCSIEVVGGATLPSSARLVAARVVEDEELAVRVCLLVFLDRGSTSDATSSQPIGDGRKRRRTSTADSQRISLASESSAPSLYFFRLTCVNDSAHHAQMLLLNRVEIPVSGTINETDGADPGELQVLLADGPHVVVFSHAAQQLAILRLIQDGNVAEFHFWREGIDIGARSGGDKHLVKSIESCEFLSASAATHTHLLIGVSFKRDRNRAQLEWLVFPTDERLPESMLTQALGAVYMPDLTSAGEHASEQVVCCCVATREDIVGDASAVHDWMQPLSQQQPARIGAGHDVDLRVDLSVRSFLVVGTTRNSLFVYENGLLLASLVLPATPAEIRVLGHDSEAHRCVIVVHCSNLNRSCFLLAFNTVARSESIEILQAFNHVGEALVGEFSFMEQATSVLPAQVMLLNHLPISHDALAAPDDEHADELQQLVKRSVLLQQPSAEAKTLCIRLRLRESSKTDGKAKKSRGVKRPRSGKADDGSTAFRVFKYIERTHKGPSGHGQGDSSFGDHNLASGEEEGAAGLVRRTASHAHLDTLVKSLEARLSNGVHELERLEGITRDKRALCRRLDQLVMREWWESNSEKQVKDGLLLSLAPVRPPSKPKLVRQEPILGRLESVIRASDEPTSADADADDEMVEGRRDVDSRLSCAVAMGGLRVVDYIPSASALRVEVTLVNNSSSVLLDTFVTMALASQQSGRSRSLSPISSDAGRLSMRSSVVAAFHPYSAADRQDHTGLARFHVELKLERPPLRLLRGEQPLLAATVWLHWQESHDYRSRSKLGPPVIDRQRSVSRRPSSFAVGSVAISAADLMATSARPHCVPAEAARQELLFLSTGSSLPAWFGQLQSPPDSDDGERPRLLIPTLVRPTFALAKWAVGDRQAAAFALGRALDRLPRDVYVMRNPLQAPHLMHLLRCLHGLRREILSVQRRAVVPPMEEAAPVVDVKQGEDGKDQVSTFVRSHHRLQRETDLRVVDLLRALKIRADFHETWVSGSA